MRKDEEKGGDTVRHRCFVDANVKNGNLVQSPKQK